MVRKVLIAVEPEHDDELVDSEFGGRPSVAVFSLRFFVALPVCLCLLR